AADRDTGNVFHRCAATLAAGTRRLGTRGARTRRGRVEPAGSRAERGGMPRTDGALPRREPLSLDRRHDPPRVWARRIPPLRAAAAAPGRGPGPRPLRATRADRTPRGRGARRLSRVPADAGRLSRALPRRRSDAPDAVTAALSQRRLQLLAPGSLWRAGVSAAGGHPALATGAGSRRRRVDLFRAASAPSVARYRRRRPGRHRPPL